jgi:uncharacterized protein involved in exopolysaccharide biosynthesis
LNQSNDKQSNLVRRDENEEDEIDLLELWRTLLKYKRMILSVTLGAAIVATGVSLTMPNIYRAEILLAPVESGDSKGGLSSALGGLGGLASLAGISVGGGGSVEENLAVLKSKDFLWQFVQDKKLMPILFKDEWDEKTKSWKETDPKKQPGQMDAHRLFTNGGVLSVEKDKKSQLITVAIEWDDAALATEWTNDLVNRLNRYLSQQAIARSERNLNYLKEELMRTQIEEMRKIVFELIANEQKKTMMANTQKDFAFKVLDSAVEPDKKFKPKRSIIIVVATFVAACLAILYAFINEGIAKRREESISQQVRM